MQSGEERAISEVKVGDRILAADVNKRQAFADIIALPHGHNNDKANFLKISTTENSLKPTISFLLVSAALCSN